MTFHQSYSYEQFVEGIMPVLNSQGHGGSHRGNSLSYEIRDGIFKEICSDASRNRESNYVLIIDEINRGNVSRIFGELITLIEESRRSTLGDIPAGGVGSDPLEALLPYSRRRFSVPSNLFIIGTMNTADRSLVTLDTALRRRFFFIEMPPRTDDVSEDVDGIDVKKLMETLNRRIAALYDQDHQLGQAFFLNLKTMDDLNDAFVMKVIPQLQEYFHDDYEKIKLILSDAKTNKESEFIKEGDDRPAFKDTSLVVNRSYRVSAPDDPQKYIDLYQESDEPDNDDAGRIDDSRI